MCSHPFYIVDVFAEAQYQGNPLAVVDKAEDLESSLMQAIAREMNYSETAFIVGGNRQGNVFPVRIFTPAEELPFAGHPVLGTAFVLQREVLKGGVKRILLDLPGGQIPVSFVSDGRTAERLWMTQKRPRFGKVVAPDRAAAALGLRPEDIDAHFPVQEVSTGLPFLIVPLRDLETVRACSLKLSSYAVLRRELALEGMLVFAPQTYSGENDLNVRVFFDCHGPVEDPATGSANGCLAGYLLRHRYYSRHETIELRVEQGCEIGRPSLLLLRAAFRKEGLEVEVGGRVLPAARGELVSKGEGK
jgi:trans-2,3-dihydro-3-hydroxyanthranilate isomerase